MQAWLRRPSAAAWGAALLLIASPAAAGAQEAADPLAGFDAYVAEAARAWGVPGLAVAVVKGDSVVFAKGYGTRTAGRDEPVDEHTLFAVGSTTKAFTVAALATLADSGRVRWDAPAREYLPQWELRDPYVRQELQVRDLVTHRSGVEANDFLWLLGYPRAELMRRMRHLPQASSLRSRYAYNNLMYMVAGEVAAAAAGRPWEALVQERFLAPLGMERTTPTLAGARGRPNVATPHLREDDRVQAIEYRDIDNIAAAGSMMSSVSDMARWIRFQLDSARVDGRRLISARAHAETFRPQFVVPIESFYPAARRAGVRSAQYGLGWFLHEYRGRPVAMHTGSIDGMSAIVGLLPEERVGVVVLANLDHAEVRHALMYRVFDAYLGGAPTDWSRAFLEVYGGAAGQERAARAALDAGRSPNTRPSLPLDGYAGSYADSLYGRLSIRREGRGLVATLGPTVTGDLSHYGYDTFRVRWREPGASDNLVVFILGPTGTPTGATILGLETFDREPEPLASPRR